MPRPAFVYWRKQAIRPPMIAAANFQDQFDDWAINNEILE
jgi:hypothetical protein